MKVSQLLEATQKLLEKRILVHIPEFTQSNQELPVYVNPSISEIAALLNKQIKRKDKSLFLRGYFAPENNNYYIWDSHSAIHGQVAKALGLEYNSVDSYENRCDIRVDGDGTIRFDCEFFDKIKNKPPIARLVPALDKIQLQEAYVFDKNGNEVEKEFSADNIHRRCTNLTLKAFGICSNTVQTESVNESKSSPLYHATSLYKAADILKANTMLARTDQHINRKRVMGVSLTRNANFAKTFDNVADHSRIIFVIDQAKLATRYKIIPIDFFTTHPDSDDAVDDRGDPVTYANRRKNRWAESEEFVVGDIKNLDSYITKIIISKECAEWTKERMSMPDGSSGDEKIRKTAAKEWIEKYNFVASNPKSVVE